MDPQTHEESIPRVDSTHEQDVHHLFQAIRKGKTHLSKFMLAASNNTLLNCWSNEGRTPLIECCYIREELTRGIMVRLLKDAGADVNMKDRYGKTALIHACEQRCNDVVKILIQHANISPDVEDVDGNTALIHSAYIGNDVALELLVKNFRRLGLNMDHYNKAGYTALHVATTKGFIQCAKILTVKGKASLTLKDKVHRLTPLEWCLKMGFQKSEVEFLKPAAKFYKVAKLTTTMVKCRKKSEQELPVPQLSPRRSPTIEKPKFKVRSLLHKSKPPSAEEAGSASIALVHKQVSQPTKSKTNEKNAMAKFIAKSKSNFLSKSKYKHFMSKGRQRSLSQTDPLDEVQAAAIVSTGLTHSRSQPVTSVCLLAIASEGSSEGETSQENIQEFITLPGDYGECDTDDLDSCKLDLDSDYLSAIVTQRNVISYGRDRVHCGEVDSCNSTTNTISSVSYEEGRVYSGTSSSNSTDSPAGYCRHGIDTPGNMSGFYASGESSYSEQSIRSCTESTPSSSNSFPGRDTTDASDTSEEDSSLISSDETHTTVIDKNPENSQSKLSSSKQVKHSSKSKQTVFKHKTDISNPNKRPISEPGFDEVSQKTEIEYLDDICGSSLSQDMTLQMTVSNSGRNTFYASNSAVSQNRSGCQSVFTKSILESQSTDRNLMSPETEIELIDHDDESQSVDIPLLSRNFEIRNSAPQLHLSNKESVQPMKRDNNNTVKGHAMLENREENFYNRDVVLKSECFSENSIKTREESNSPNTEVIYIDMVTPDNMTEDSTIKCLDITKSYQRANNDQNLSHCKGECDNKINPATTIREDVVSPQTAMEYIDMRTPDNTVENSIPDSFNHHKGHHGSEDKTKIIRGVTLPRDKFNDEIKHIRMTQISPQTEIDYIELHRSHESTENYDDESSEEPKTSLDDDNDDDLNDEGNDTAVGRTAVRKSLHDFTENVMTLVDLATSQGFVVESKQVMNRRTEQEEADHSSCEGSCASSGVETLIDNLENDLSCLSVESLFPSINGEAAYTEEEGEDTCT